MFDWFKWKVITFGFRFIDFVETKRIIHKGDLNSPDPLERHSTKGTRFDITLTNKNHRQIGRYSMFKEE